MTRSLALLALAALLGASCAVPSTTDVFAGYPIAAATNDCGPAGGPATTLVLRPAPREIDAAGQQLRVTIWKPFGEVAGHTFSSTDPEPIGAALECDVNADCRESATWRVTFERAGADSVLKGVLEFPAADGTVRRGSFRATWHERVVYCI